MSDKPDDSFKAFLTLSRLPALANMNKRKLSKNDVAAGKASKKLELKIDSFRRLGAPTYPPKAFKRVHLETVDKNLFLARKEQLWKPSTSNVIFGGQVIGQSLAAAISSSPSDKVLHSMHCYFLVGGSNKSDIVYTVLPVRDGKSFCARLVMAQQNGVPIFILTASFQKPEISGLSHYIPAPPVPHPDELIQNSDMYLFLSEFDDRMRSQQMRDNMVAYATSQDESPLEMKYVQCSDMLRVLGPFDREKYIADGTLPKGYPQYTTDGTIMVWIKTKQELPKDDLDTHRAVIGYASDLNLLLSALEKQKSRMDAGMIASLDHSMWFHADFRMDEWMLYVIEGQSAQGGRGLAFGRFYRADGVLAVTCTQEGVIRLREDIDSFKGAKL